MKNFSTHDFVTETCHNQTEANNLLNMCYYAMEKFKYTGIAPLINNIIRELKSKYNDLRTFNVSTKHIYGWSDNTVPTIEIHASHVCNLNCAYCSHYSPIAGKSAPVDVDRMISDIKNLGKIPNQEQYIKQIDVLGGEPLLCNRLDELLEACNELGNQHTLKFVVSNGILITQDKIDKCASYGFDLQITRYPSVTIPDGVHPYSFHNAKYMDTMPKTIEPSNPCHGKYACTNGKCLQLRDGALHLCSISAYADFPEKEFGIELPRSKYDYLMLTDIETYEEIILFSYLQHPFCRHCVINQNTSAPWAKTTRQLDEWFK